MLSNFWTLANLIGEKIIYQCNFNLHFPYFEWAWTSLCTFKSSLYFLALNVLCYPFIYSGHHNLPPSPHETWKASINKIHMLQWWSWDWSLLRYWLRAKGWCVAKPNSILPFALGCLNHPCWTWKCAELQRREEPGTGSLETWLSSSRVTGRAFRPEPPPSRWTFRICKIQVPTHPGPFQKMIRVESTPWIFYCYFFLNRGNKTVFKPPKLRTFKSHTFMWI